MTKIPTIIHQVFFAGEAAVPQKYRRFHQSVLQHHPHWEHYFWDEANSKQFMVANYSWFLPVYESYAYPIQRWDAIRYFLLHHYGGFYLDMDIECLKPLDALLGEFELVLSKLVGISNAVMGSIPQHPLWPQVFAELEKRTDPTSCSTSNRLFGNSMPYYICYSTGPILIDDCVLAGQFHTDDRVRICPGYVFEPGVPMELDGKIFQSQITDDSHTIHHMTVSWLPWHRRIFRAAVSPFFSLYWAIAALSNRER